MLLLLLLWLKWFDYFYTILPSPVPFSCHFEPLEYNVQFFIYIHVIRVKNKRKAMLFVACKMIYCTMLVRQMHRVKPSKWLVLMLCFVPKTFRKCTVFFYIFRDRTLLQFVSNTDPLRRSASKSNTTPTIPPLATTDAQKECPIATLPCCLMTWTPLPLRLLLIG